MNHRGSYPKATPETFHQIILSSNAARSIVSVIAGQGMLQAFEEERHDGW
jgi:hypothetical protein